MLHLYKDPESNIHLKAVYAVCLCLPNKLISESSSVEIEPATLGLEAQ